MGLRFKTVNPATGEAIREFETISKSEALEHAQKSRLAFEKWKDLSVESRANYLRNLVEVLRKHKDQYARIMTLEMGKPIAQSLAEIEKCAWAAEVYAENGQRWLEEEIYQTDAAQSMVVFQPLGVILSIMPWNFPFWQALRFGIPTLLAGNTGLLRHSNVCPESAIAIEDACREAGFPEYVWKTIISDHSTVDALVASNWIAGVSLTGSEQVGAKIGQLAGSYLKKCVLELGGSDPFIVLDDVDLDVAAKNAALARAINSGQSCIAAKRFIVSEKVIKDFAMKFAEYMQRLKVGDPMDTSTEVGPLVREDQIREIEGQVADAVKLGGRILTGGKRLDRNGFFYSPTVIDNVTLNMRVVREEVFGPVAPIIPARNDEEAMRLANDSEFGLGAGIWSSSRERALKLAKRIETGVVFINEIVKSDPRMPFGGVKKSGVGRELSKYGLREFVNVKGISIYEKQTPTSTKTE